MQNQSQQHLSYILEQLHTVHNEFCPKEAKQYEGNSLRSSINRFLGPIKADSCEVHLDDKNEEEPADVKKIV